MNSLKTEETLKKWIQRTFNDSIAEILRKNSNLTKTQLETLLIDILAENYAEKSLNYEEKGRLRLTKVAVSRGSFNRTLQQAKKNVTESIYTILLLGYLGVIQSPSLAPFLEVANKLQTYATALKTLSSYQGKPEEQLRIINALREDLEATLKTLSTPFKPEDL